MQANSPTRFWLDRVPSLTHSPCDQYGFLLTQVQLNSKVSIALNTLLYFSLGLICLYLLVLKLRYLLGFPDPAEGRTRRISRSHKERHIALLRNIDTWIKTAVAVGVTIGVELTISWNEIRGADSLDGGGAGNTIPLVIGVVAIMRILYVAMFYDEDDDDDHEDEDESDDSDGDSYSSYESRSPSSPRPWPPPPFARQVPVRRHYTYAMPLSSSSTRPIPIRQMPGQADIAGGAGAGGSMRNTKS